MTVTEIAMRGLYRLPVGALTVNKLNPRRRVGDVTELADSIAQNGLIQPIVVERHPGGRYVVIAGHRRLAALKHLGEQVATCLVIPPKRPAEQLAAMLVENGQRADLDPIEEARAIRRLMDTQRLNQHQVAKVIGKSQTHVSHRLTLLALPESEQEKVRTRETRVVDAIQAGRKAKGTHEQTRYTGWHLGKTHPLADTVRATCKAAGHGVDRRVGGIGCGRCWEQAIRDDERARHTTGTPS